MEKLVDEKLYRLKEIEERLLNPDIMNDQKKYVELLKEKKTLEEIASLYKQYLEIKEQWEDDKDIIKNSDDPELKKIAESEIDALVEKLLQYKSKIYLLLNPPDPEDKNNAVMEIRAGTGGDEAAIFAGDLFRMYGKYAESKGWKITLVDVHPTPHSGFKEVIFLVEGSGAYGRLKYESGVHRVQRVPITESGGRIHTSAATVAVLPEVQDIEFEIKQQDLKMEFFHSSGPGGQNVNKVETGVRIIHIPTGITVACQEERSQYKNRIKAMRILKAKLFDIEKRKKEREISDKRRSLIGSGDRSEKIRTYNFPQNRVTDHRINLTLYNLQEVLNGKIDTIIDRILEYDVKLAAEKV